MRAILQRVSWARVIVDDGLAGQCHTGLLVYMGVFAGDEVPDA